MLTTVTGLRVATNTRSRQIILLGNTVSACPLGSARRLPVLGSTCPLASIVSVLFRPREVSEAPSRADLHDSLIRPPALPSSAVGQKVGQKSDHPKNQQT